ncbi:CRISPR-associated endonuclease Cas1 [Methanosarcina vacuolata]|uniref:CRISPR-associated endonuclease Cas1 n=1 Tax=Methanosarcina vacuolata TaxID=2215 RepID=UPI0006980A7F|nr:CRISPR-associated endonuclease Cas1 [Methanosarcina vacuolata]
MNKCTKTIAEKMFFFSRHLRKVGFRFLVDLAVISLIESGAMESKDFIRTENYNLRLKPTGARKIVNEFSNMLNKKVSY